MDYDIKAAIPHREPFLFLDRVIAVTGEEIRAEYELRPDDELWSRVYGGHYPGSPITPGVLLCEMMFQAAAVLVHEMGRAEPLAGVPVVTRIQGVKFKNMVFPGDRVEIRARLAERMGSAFFMKGSVLKDGKTAVQADFAVAMAPAGSAGTTA